MHYLDFNETFERKTRREHLKDDPCCSEQILLVEPHKTAAVRWFSSHPTYHRIKMSKTWCVLLQNQERTHKQRSPVVSFVDTYQCCLTSKNVYKSALSGHWIPWRGPCKNDGLLGQMAWREREMRDRDRKRETEREKGICAICMTWR